MQSSNSSAWGLPFNRTPEGKIDQRRFGGHTRNHGEGPVRRAAYAADRTGHMILQTLYQQCVKNGVEFFNEFYVLDLLMAGDRVAGVVAYELGTGELHVFHAKTVLFATGGYGQDIQGHLERARADRRWSRRSCSAAASRSKTWSSSSSTRPASTGSASCSPRLRAARAASSATRPASGSWSGTRRRSRTSRLATWSSRAIYLEIKRGPRHGTEEGLRPSARGPPRPEGHRREAPRHHRVRADLPRRRAADRGSPDPADRALRDGRHPDEHRRAGRRRRRRTRRCPACTRPASARACRCTARTVSARTRCSTSSCSDVAAESRWPRRPSGRLRRLPEIARAATREAARKILLDATRLESIGAHPRRAAAAMDDDCGVYRTDDTLRRARWTRRAAAGDVTARPASDDKSQRYNTDLMEAVELGFLLDLAQTHGRRAPSTHRIPRRPLPRRLRDARRRELAQALAGVEDERHSEARLEPVKIRYEPTNGSTDADPSENRR